MNRVQSKNKKLSKVVTAHQAEKSSAKARKYSSESSGVESASEATFNLGSSSDTESISSSSDVQSSITSGLESISLYSDVQRGTSGPESISSSSSFYSLCSSSDDYSKPGKSEEAVKPEEAAKNTEEEEEEDDEAEKTAIIAKLMERYKTLDSRYNQVMDAVQTNDKLIGETQKTTDYMMNLMEGSSVTEPLHFMMRRKTKYNLMEDGTIDFCLD